MGTAVRSGFTNNVLEGGNYGTQPEDGYISSTRACPLDEKRPNHRFGGRLGVISGSLPLNDMTLNALAFLHAIPPIARATTPVGNGDDLYASGASRKTIM